MRISSRGPMPLGKITRISAAEQASASYPATLKLLPVVGATEERLGGLKIPACIICGNDQVHTPSAARKAAALISASEFHDDVVAKRLENDLLKEWDQKEWKDKEGRLVEIFTAFLKRIDK